MKFRERSNLYARKINMGQIVEKYPDKWLALSDCKLDEENDATIIEANIIKVFETWDDYYTFRDNNIGKGYRYEYTAEPTMSGVQYGADMQESRWIYE